MMFDTPLHLTAQLSEPQFSFGFFLHWKMSDWLHLQLFSAGIAECN